MPGTNEAFSRVKIDVQLKDQSWEIDDPNAVRFEVMLGDGTRADYLLCDRHGRSLAVIEAKKAATNPAEAEAQAKAYAALKASSCTRGLELYTTLHDFPPDADDLAAVLHVTSRIDNAELRAICDDALHVVFEHAARPDGSVETWIVDRFDHSLAMRNIDRCITVIGGRGVHIDVVANLMEGVIRYAAERFTEQIQQAADFLLSVQMPAGQWPSKWYWGELYGTFRAVRVLKMETQNGIRTYQSRTVSTAFCLKALLKGMAESVRA